MSNGCIIAGLSESEESVYFGGREVGLFEILESELDFKRLGVGVEAVNLFWGRGVWTDLLEIEESNLYKVEESDLGGRIIGFGLGSLS